MMIVKFTTSNFESFMDNFKLAVSRVDGIHGVTADYIIREFGINYNDNWTSRR